VADQPPGQSVVATGLPNPTRNPRQVFVAYPYTIYDKADYRRPFNDLAKAFNVVFVFADEKITTLHILQKIADYIRSSRFGIYDISAWNANVTLELGLAYGLNEKAYIISNPKQHQASEVPADLRGIDRIQYTSFAELQSGLEKILTQEFPIQPTHDVENQLTTLRNLAVDVIQANHEGLKITDIADLLGVTIDVAKVVVYPLVGKELRTEGVKKGTRYFAI
jgi:predicted nucleotide-binding protein